jgi:hypothetical protein
MRLLPLFESIQAANKKQYQDVKDRVLSIVGKKFYLAGVKVWIVDAVWDDLEGIAKIIFISDISGDADNYVFQMDFAVNDFTLHIENEYDNGELDSTPTLMGPDSYDKLDQLIGSIVFGLHTDRQAPADDILNQVDFNIVDENKKTTMRQNYAQRLQESELPSSPDELLNAIVSATSSVIGGVMKLSGEDVEKLRNDLKTLKDLDVESIIGLLHAKFGEFDEDAIRAALSRQNDKPNEDATPPERDVNAISDWNQNYLGETLDWRGKIGYSTRLLIARESGLADEVALDESVKVKSISHSPTFKKMYEKAEVKSKDSRPRKVSNEGIKLIEEFKEFERLRKMFGVSNEVHNNKYDEAMMLSRFLKSSGVKNDRTTQKALMSFSDDATTLIGKYFSL